ncbi:MAG: peptidylprolyl isomerase [Verrucomicrobia subdivision 3 bacterium]|nr:peptidylprolyl isomerase [Limisphaerales bacterium]
MTHPIKGFAFGMVAAAIALNAADAPKTASVNATKAPSRFADLFDDPVVAQGQGVLVKQSELDQAFIAYKANLAARGQNIPESERVFREAQMLERLVITQLMSRRATAEDHAKAKAAVVKYKEETRTSEESLQRSLKALGITAELFEKRIYDQALSEAVVARELKSQIQTTDAQVETFYKTGSDLLVQLLQKDLETLAKNVDTPPERLSAIKRQIDDIRKANLAKLEQPEKVRVSHILLATRDRNTEKELSEETRKIKRLQIERILTRARAGDDFAKLVMEYSEDRNLKETKGEYILGRDDRFVPEFKAAAFSLEPGRISDIVTTIYGYHILKLHEKIPASKIPFEKVVSEIQQHLTQQELQRRMPEYFAKLRKEADVKVLDAKYRFETPAGGTPVKPAG